MNAIDLILTQHRDVRSLFDKIEKATDSGMRRLFLELSDVLAIHMTLEERIFYPQVKTADTEELLKESLQEHLQAKRLVADLLDELDDDTFEAKCAVLKEEVLHHLREEESKLIPKVRKACTTEELENLGGEMESLMAEIQDTEPRRRVPGEVETAPPIE